MDNYLGYEICAVLNNWLIVYDSQYNYYLIDTGVDRVWMQYNRGNMPSNELSHKFKGMRKKQVEYYSNFENALKNMILNFLNKGFRC